MSSILQIKNLSKTISKSEILKNISLHITKGSVFGFLGPNGAGKTTTMKCILGLMRPTSGSIELFGEKELSTRTLSRIGFMPENTYLYKYLTGEEFLIFNANFYPKIADSKDERITKVLDRVGLAHARHKRLSTYSKGMLQRIGLAQSILHDPEIIFLDEPMSGLDPIGRKMVKDLILDLKKEGKTIFFNTHILSDVEATCDHFAILSRGEKVADMSVKDLKKPLEDYFMEVIEKHTGGNFTIQ